MHIFRNIFGGCSITGGSWIVFRCVLVSQVDCLNSVEAHRLYRRSQNIPSITELRKYGAIHRIKSKIQKIWTSPKCDIHPWWFFPCVLGEAMETFPLRRRTKVGMGREWFGKWLGESPFVVLFVVVRGIGWAEFSSILHTTSTSSSRWWRGM